VGDYTEYATSIREKRVILKLQAKQGQRQG